MKKLYKDLTPDTEVIFVSTITLRNGKRLRARDFGLKAFPIRVRKAKS